MKAPRRVFGSTYWFDSGYMYGDRIVAIKVLEYVSKTKERVALDGRFARVVAMRSRREHELQGAGHVYFMDHYVVALRDMMNEIFILRNFGRGFGLKTRKGLDTTLTSINLYI
ncbi:hypothetical protein M8C21_016136, partial [Ambrosia artemisiifolia]